MAKARSGLITSAIALALLAGCTPAQPTMAPPKPSPTCTPEAGGPAYPCSPYYYDQMVAKDKLYAEAETVYRKFFAEEERIYRAGGVTEPTPVLLETATGEYLKDSAAFYKYVHDHGIRAEGGEFRISWIKRAPGVSSQGSIVALESCKDARSVALTQPNKKPTAGGVVNETALFVRVGPALKLTAAESKEVASC